ncbi:CidA/LrgA family protein [Paracoccus sp. ME4]|uniref:CidA/LrgA family protein n=1 Tax=Paracoccus sp. ME4 TaxID=3138066 RepID=UPI00398B0C5C
MIRMLAIILAFQLGGEVASRALALPLPGPVTGLVALVLACMIRPALAEAIRPAATGLLAHLSLFFVPAGVGIVAHWDLVRDQGLGLAAALTGSTLLAIAAGAWAFTAVARLTGSEEREALRDQGRE